MLIYYAHCKAIYDTPQEKRDIELLEKLGFRVLNPNHSEHQANCMSYSHITGNNEMVYFYDLVRSCDAVAFRALPTMEIPAGVYGEVTEAIKEGKLIIELPSRILTRGIDVETTREYLKECGQR